MLELTTISRDHLTHMYRKHMTDGFLQMRRQEIEEVVRSLGADKYDLLLPETHILPLIIDLNETIEGLVYGRYKMGGIVAGGRGALVATDKRLILVDRKPLYMKCQEISYAVVGGIGVAWAGPMGTVTLTLLGSDIRVRTMNRACAETFMRVVETHMYRQQSNTTGEIHNDYVE